MSNKKSKLGVISAVAAGTGTAIYLAQKAKKESGNSESGNSIFKKSTVADSSVPDNYRNTERGKYDRNSKGIYYSNGNYEAFAHPEKPEGVDQKNAYIVGSGLASLAAACFLVRDAQMPGCQIHILEAMDIAGGACDGIYDTSRGYVMRGGREMEIISNVCGISSAAFHPSRHLVFLYLMNITGSINMTRTIPFAVQL